MAASIMPKVTGLNTLIRCGSGGSKIVCESLYSAENLAATSCSNYNEHGSDSLPNPSDSFCLSMEDELDWLDLHGHGQVSFFDRSHSTKAGDFLDQYPSKSASFSSHRRSVKKSAGAYLVFPKMPDSRGLARPPNRRQFRLNKSSSRVIFPPIAEPSSPKVTCIGRVRTIREKAVALQRKKSKRESPPTKKKSLWSPIAALFRFRLLHKRGPNAGPQSEDGSLPVAAPGLGGMRKFESGRRPASYGVAAEPVC